MFTCVHVCVLGGAVREDFPEERTFVLVWV